MLFARVSCCKFERRELMAEPEYDSRLFQVGALWESVSRTSGNPILSGEISLGLFGPRDVLITQNSNPERSDRSPTHIIFIRVPLRERGENGAREDARPSRGGRERAAVDEMDR
jgi:hypothetical protein